MRAEEIVRALAAMPDRWFDDTCEFCGVDAYGGDLTTHSPGCAYAAAKRWVAEHPVFDAADATWETVDLRTARWVSVGEPRLDVGGADLGDRDVVVVP